MMSALDLQEMVPAIPQKNAPQKEAPMMAHVLLALEFVVSSHYLVEILHQKTKHIWFNLQQHHLRHLVHTPYVHAVLIFAESGLISRRWF